MVAFAWRRITELEGALSEVAADLRDAIEIQPDSVDPYVIELVRGMPLDSTDGAGMGERSSLIFHEYLCLLRLLAAFSRATAYAQTLDELDKREAVGAYARPASKA